jgi:chromosomal replication initiator protein DnaA
MEELCCNVFREADGMVGRERGTSTPQDLLLPEGKLIRTTRGGVTALKQLLLDLKKYSFSGYVRTVRSTGGTRSEGIVLLRGGNPEASLFQRGEMRERGRSALKRVWQDSYDEGCTIELHARVDMDALLREHSNATLERPAKVVKRAKVPQAMDHDEIESKLRSWKERGYDVSSVEAAYDGDPGILTASFLAMLEAVKKAEAVADTLSYLDVSGFEARAATLRDKLRDPLRNPDIDTEVESLRDAIEAHRRIEARRQIELARERDSQERTMKVVELVMKQRQALRPEAPSPSQEEIARALESPAPSRDEATNLILTHTFDSFVVGASNRFAETAAVSVAMKPSAGYNPLVIVSGPGLGKTHLLNAIGNRVHSEHPGRRVLYVACDALAASHEETTSKGNLQSFRDRLRGVDVLLLDDLQLVSGKPGVQEELLRAFDEFQGANRQLVVASDRPPKAITDMDDRLVSRLEAGLIASIQPPERETRLAILERRAKGANRPIDPSVLALIADRIEDNVRELQGALNRVVAFSSLMDRSITQDLAKEVLRDVMGEPSKQEKGPAKGAPHVLVPGGSYLVEEDRPEAMFQLAEKTPSGGKGCLVITRTNPKRIRERLPFDPDRILWLTDRESSAEETIAPALERIVYEIERFMKARPRGAILLDGIEYLVSNNSFDAVLKFVRRLVDTISEGHFAFLISLGPATLKEQELKMLEREMDVVRVA